MNTSAIGKHCSEDRQPGRRGVPGRKDTDFQRSVEATETVRVYRLLCKGSGGIERPEK
jgi:hypothetical protein